MKCPSCHAESPVTQKFCGECGARLSYTPAHLAQRILSSRSALEGERKLVTVMFCDIADSTALAVRIGAEAMHALLDRFFELGLAQVHRYEGTVNQFLGDGFMALFGAPIAHEDHARRALLAALGLQEQLRAAREIEVRIGVDTGLVVVGRIGDNLRSDYTAIGDTTHLAARLQAHAPAGAIHVSEATFNATRAHFDFKAVGAKALKGIAQRAEVYELVDARPAGARAAPAAPEGIASVLVGRERELAVLCASVDALARGRGGVVIVQGEPGVGKSRLVAESRRRHADLRTRWLEGRALSFGRHMSYWPFIEVLKTCFGIVEDDDEARAWSKLELGIAGLFGERASEVVPFIGTVLSLPLTGDHERRVKDLQPHAQGLQVFLCMRQLVERLAERQPLLVVMEDWHWVDRSSVALCEHLLPLAGSAALAFWFVARAEPVDAMERIRECAARLGDANVHEVMLAPLRHDHCDHLIDNLLGGCELPWTVRSQILQRAEGNPFFIEEVIRALVGDGTLMRDGAQHAWRLAKPLDTLALPDTIQGIILARIDRLDEDVKGMLKLASVIGRSFFLRILQAICEADAALLEGDMRRLEQTDLIRLRQRFPEIEYTFKHALVQEAVYGSILVERRRAIHHSVALAIERLFADRIDEFTSLLAYHYALAAQWEPARAYLLRAGDQASRVAADAEALEHYRQAEAIYMKLAGERLTDLERASLERRLGQAYYGIGDYDRSVEHFTRGLAHLGVRYPATSAGVIRGICKSLAGHLLWRLVPVRWRPGMDPVRAREVATIAQQLMWLDYFADEGRGMLDCLIELRAGECSGEPVALSQGLAALALAFSTVGTTFGIGRLGLNRLAQRYTDRAFALAQGCDNRAAIGYASLAFGMTQLNAKSWREAVRAVEEAGVAYKAAGDLRGWGGAASVLCGVSGFLGDLPRSHALASELMQVGTDAGDPHVSSWGALFLGAVACIRGPLSRATEHLSLSCDLAARSSNLRIRAVASAWLGRSLLYQGRLVDASEALAEARRIAHEGKVRAFSMATPLSAWAEFRLAMLERDAGAPRGDALRDARRACRDALLWSRTTPAWLPEALRLHGTLAWLSGDVRTARARWLKSIALAQAFAFPIERARGLFEMGKHLRDVSLLDEAIDVFAHSGAHVYLDLALDARVALAPAERRA